MFRSTLLLLWITTILSVSADFAQAANIPKLNFAPGQMWSIKSATPTTTKVIIGRREEWGGKIAVHVSVIDVPIPSDMPGAGRTTTVHHMPFDEAALAASVDQLLVTDASPAPNFESGYAQWQSADGGIYTINVSKAVEILFDTLRQQSRS